MHGYKPIAIYLWQDHWSETMSGVIKARYENKVLKPLEDIDLKEGEEVEIRVRGSATSRIFGIVKCWEGLEEAHEDYRQATSNGSVS